MISASNAAESRRPPRHPHPLAGAPTRRLARASLLFSLLGLAFTLAAAPAPRPPNIVVILGDDIDYGDFGCNGATAVKTPNVDRVAREGLRFTSAYASSANRRASRIAPS